MSIAPEEVFRVWLLLIEDEALADATLAGRHRELARDRSPLELEILDAFAAMPGTRWNLENLRFRAAAEAAASLKSYLPRTMQLLTRGDPDWLQELAFEYLAHHRWQELGHHRYGECERFADYARARVFKRRVPPPHVEAVLGYELAVIALYKKTATLAPGAFPMASAPDDDGALAQLRPLPAPASSVIDLPVDLFDWIRSRDPSTGSVGPTPISLLLVVPSLKESHRIFRLGEAARRLHPLFTGASTVGAIAEEAERRFGFSAGAVLGQTRKWIAQKALVV